MLIVRIYNNVLPNVHIRICSCIKFYFSSKIESHRIFLGNLNVCNLERVWIRFREKTDLETEQETELNFYNNNNLSIC